MLSLLLLLYVGFQLLLASPLLVGHLLLLAFLLLLASLMLLASLLLLWHLPCCWHPDVASYPVLLVCLFFFAAALDVSVFNKMKLEVTLNTGL
jgi:hypothetical protein